MNLKPILCIKSGFTAQIEMGMSPPPFMDKFPLIYNTISIHIDSYMYPPVGGARKSERKRAAIQSIDIRNERDFPVYHTAFDSYNWMTHFGDPLFQRHVAVTGIWGLLALHLADDSILPFNYLSYTSELQDYTNILSDLLKGSISLHPIIVAIQEFEAAAKKAEEEAKKLREQESLGGGALLLKKRTLNDRLMFAERGFLDADGIQGSQWFKHLV